MVKSIYTNLMYESCILLTVINYLLRYIHHNGIIAAKVKNIGEFAVKGTFFRIRIDIAFPTAPCHVVEQIRLYVIPRELHILRQIIEELHSLPGSPVFVFLTDILCLCVGSINIVVLHQRRDLSVDSESLESTFGEVLTL